MHLSCYKIKLYYHYLHSALRRASTVFTSCVISKNYKSCTDVTDIHLPRRSVSSFLGSLSSPYLSTLSYLSLPLSLSRCLFLSVHLSLSLSSLAVPYCLPSQEKAYARHCVDPELRRSGNCVKFTVERYSIDCGVCI